MRWTLLVLAVALLAHIPAPACGIIYFFDDFSSFELASGPLTLTTFADLTDGQVVTDQYLSNGIRFTDGNDVARASAGFLNDGLGLHGGNTSPTSIGIQLLQPTHSFGVVFPGALRLDVFDQQGGDLQGTFDHGLTGAGFFAGVVSDDPFQFVCLSDWVDGSVNIDDLYSSAQEVVPIPEPTTALLLVPGLVLVGLLRRDS